MRVSFQEERSGRRERQVPSALVEQVHKPFRLKGVSGTGRFESLSATGEVDTPRYLDLLCPNTPPRGGAEGGICGRGFSSPPGTHHPHI
jgi:hypothetical protein